MEEVKMRAPVAEELTALENPLVRLAAEAYEHLNCVSTNEAEKRISIFGFAEVIREENIFCFNRIILPKQTATFRHSVVWGSHVALLPVLDECRWRGLDPDKLSGLWIMPAMKKNLSWNPENDFASVFPFSSDFLVSLLWNRGGKLLAKVDILATRKTFPKVPVEISKEPKFIAPLPMLLDNVDKVRNGKRIRGGKK